MPLLIAGGDSFTWGSELPDQHMDHLANLPSQLTWSARISQHFGWEYSCVAKPGGANSTISRRVIKAVNQNKDTDIYIAVMWTFSHRNEIRLRNIHPYNTIVHDPVVTARYDIDDYWINFTAWHGLSFEEKMEFFPKDIDSERYEFFREQHDKMTEIGITDASKYFYAPTGDYYYHQYNFMKEINFLQFYLQSKNIKYFFCAASDEVFNSETTLASDSGLWQTINWNNWYKDAAFHKWSEFHTRCGSHPGPDAHHDWLQLILPKVQKCFQE